MLRRITPINMLADVNLGAIAKAHFSTQLRIFCQKETTPTKPYVLINIVDSAQMSVWFSSRVIKFNCAFSNSKMKLYLNFQTRTFVLRRESFFFLIFSLSNFSLDIFYGKVEERTLNRTENLFWIKNPTWSLKSNIRDIKNRNNRKLSLRDIKKLKP